MMILPLLLLLVLPKLMGQMDPETQKVRVLFILILLFLSFYFTMFLLCLKRRSL